MNLIEKHNAYTDLQKQILGMLLRAKNVDKEYFIYLVSRLLRYQNQEEKEKDIHSKIQFLFDDSWCIAENNRIMEVAMNSDNETELLNLISEDRKKWRKQLIEDVCKYVNIENQEPVVKGLIEIDRAHFLLEELAPFADVDCPFPLFKGMTESALHAVLMTIKPLNPKKGERILICGAKGGYLSVLLAHLVGDKGKVIAIDWDERVINHCNEALKRAEIKSKNIGEKVENKKEQKKI
jgi:16S rRNA C967 or C1407 C5-methylase (RsmB/RsmF family)